MEQRLNEKLSAMTGVGRVEKVLESHAKLFAFKLIKFDEATRCKPQESRLSVPALWWDLTDQSSSGESELRFRRALWSGFLIYLTTEAR